MNDALQALQIVAERIAELRGSISDEIHAQSARNFRNLISGNPGLDKYIKILQ